MLRISVVCISIVSGCEQGGGVFALGATRSVYDYFGDFIKWAFLENGAAGRAYLRELAVLVSGHLEMTSVAMEVVFGIFINQVAHKYPFLYV